MLVETILCRQIFECGRKRGCEHGYLRTGLQQQCGFARSNFVAANDQAVFAANIKKNR